MSENPKTLIPFRFAFFTPAKKVRDRVVKEECVHVLDHPILAPHGKSAAGQFVRNYGWDPRRRDFIVRLFTPEEFDALNLA